MATRKKSPPPEATKPAFVVADAQHTDFLGLSKVEAFAAFIAMGVYAGPAGRVMLDSTDDEMLQNVAEVCFRQGVALAAHGARVLASMGARS